MGDFAFENVGNRLDSTVGMPRKTSLVMCRHIIAEIIHHQKWIGLCCITKTKNAVQMHASTLHGRLGFCGLYYRSKSHRSLLCVLAKSIDYRVLLENAQN